MVVCAHWKEKVGLIVGRRWDANWDPQSQSAIFNSASHPS